MKAKGLGVWTRPFATPGIQAQSSTCIPLTHDVVTGWERNGNGLRDLSPSRSESSPGRAHLRVDAIAVLSNSFSVSVDPLLGIADTVDQQERAIVDTPRGVAVL
jgi:hypothetical protein